MLPAKLKTLLFTLNGRLPVRLLAMGEKLEID